MFTDAVEEGTEGVDVGVVPWVSLKPDFFPRLLLSSSFHAFHASCSDGL